MASGRPGLGLAVMEDTEGERWRNVNIAEEFNKVLAAKDPATARWASFTDNMVKTTNCSGHVCAGPNGAPTCGLPGVAGQGTSYVDMAEVEPGKLPGYRWHLGCILLKMAAILSLPTGVVLVTMDQFGQGPGSARGSVFSVRVRVGGGGAAPSAEQAAHVAEE